jgi:hypothetical protein
VSTPLQVTVFIHPFLNGLLQIENKNGIQEQNKKSTVQQTYFLGFLGKGETLI